MHTSEVKARDTSSRSESAEAEHSPDREPRMARAENFYRATERTERVAEFFFSWPLLQPSFGFALETPAIGISEVSRGTSTSGGRQGGEAGALHRI